jgi:hypothetical protein
MLTPRFPLIESSEYAPEPLEYGSIVAFPLIFRGPLKSAQSKGWTSLDTHAIRREFHPQIRDRMLNMRHPLPAIVHSKALGPVYEKDSPGPSWCLHRVGDQFFMPLVINHRQAVRLVAELDIQLHWRERPGNIVHRAPDGIDIDNRIKHLLDALTIPQANQIEGVSAGPEETPIYCLLQDDNLITRLSVVTARLPFPKKHDEPEHYVEANISVLIKRADDLTDSEFFG